MTNEEIIGRLERMAEHAVHTVGEKPYVIGLDDGIALYSAIEAINAQQPRLMELEELTRSNRRPVWIEVMEDDGTGAWCTCAIWNNKMIVNEFLITIYGSADSYFHKDDYGKFWRCWTACPSEAQMEAVKWDE